MSEDQRSSPKKTTIQYSGKDVHFYIADESDHIQKEISSTGRFYEQELLEYLAQDIAIEKYVVDVGANIGNHTIFFAAIIGCNVISIEPNSHLVDILNKNIVLNGIADQVEVVHGAASDQRKSATLCVDDPKNLGTGYVALNADAGVQHASVEAIECYALDEIIDSERVVGLLKIDVEGCEMDVLRGAVHLLRRDIPVVVIECHSYVRYVDSLNFFYDLGYFPAHRFNSTPTLVFLPRFEGGRALYQLLAEQVWSDGQVQFEIRKSVVAGVSREIKSLENKFRLASQKSNETLDGMSNSLAELRRELVRSKELENVNRSLTATLEKLQREGAGYRATLENNTKEIKKLKKYVRDLEVSVSFRLGRAIVEAVKSPFPGLFRLPLVLIRMVLNRGRRTIAVEPVKAASTSPVRGAKKPAPETPLVSIIVTVFNKQDWLVESLGSLLTQTYRNLEVIVVDDRSTDGSWQLLQQIARKNPLLKIFRNRENRGTYWSKNFGMVQASGSLITFHDADDISRPTRIETQVRALLENPSLMAVYGRYLRRDAAGNIVEIKGRSERPALITLMIKRDVISKIGYFDSVRYSADSEFLERLAASLGKGAVQLINEVIYEAPTLAQSLTGSGSGKLIYNESAHAFDLPPTRQAYVASYRAWHDQIKSAAQAYISFPLSQRCFDAAPEMLADHCGIGTRVCASLATMPSRVDALRMVIDRVLPQVDVIYVYLNNFDSPPDFLINDKIVTQNSAETGDLRDNGKFFFSRQIGRDAYHFTLDDDIVYPKDYVQRTILALQRYDNKVLMGVHGFNFPENFERFFNGREVLHFRDQLECDHFVNVLGTGTLAYHTSLVELDCARFETTGMVDLWVALAAKSSGIPMVSIARPKNWLSPIRNESEESLYHEYKDRDEVQTNLVRSAGSWRFVNLSQCYRDTVSHVVSAYDDQELVDYSFDVENLNLFLGRKKLNVAVVATGWNCCDEAVTCIESILAQRSNLYTLAIHVVDDASDDGTYEQLVEKYGRSNQVVRLYRTDENVGPAYSRLLALKSITDPDCIVVLVDLDDALTTDALVRVTQKYHNDSNCKMTYGNWLNQHGVCNQQDFYTRDEIDAKKYLEMEIFNFAPLRTFIRSLADVIDPKRLQEPGGEWLRYCSDVALMFGLANDLKSGQISTVNAPIYIYNQHRPTGTQNRFKERKREMYKYIQAGYRDGI